jgi:hypothetical protein
MTPQDIQTYLPFVVIAIVIAARFRSLSRPRRMRPGLLWIWPLVICLLAGFFAMGAYFKGGPLTATIVVTILVSLGLGAVAGWYRARAMHLHRDPDTGHIMMRMSIEGLIFLVALFLVRTLIRQFGGVNTDQFGAVADGLMAFIVGLLLARSYVMWRRCKALPPHRPSGEAAPGFQS